MGGNDNSFDVYSYGSGCYAYFAKVVKNYDEKEDSQIHFGEVKVQAVPYGVDYDGSVDKLESPLGQVWLPYLCDLTGADTMREKEKAKKDMLGFGFHCMPEVGSLVVVLAVESGLPGYAQHIVIGSFWNKQLLPPQLDNFSYKIAGETEYKMDHIIGDDAAVMQQRANTRYYRTKAGATFLLDDEKKVFGFYKLPAKENNAKKKSKLTRYFMVDEEHGNLDIKTGMFYVWAENINIKVGKGLTVDNKQEKGELYVGTDDGLLNVHAQDGKFDVNAKKEINKTGKKINLNHGKNKDPENAKADNPPNKDPVDPDKDKKNKEPKFFNLAVRSILEINVLREDDKFMGKDNIIRVDKGMIQFVGEKEKPDTMTAKDIELKIPVEVNDFNLILHPKDVILPEGKRLYEMESDEIEDPKSNAITEFTRTANQTWDDYKEANGGDDANPALWLAGDFNDSAIISVDLNQIKSEDGTETVDVIRRVVFKCNRRPEGRPMRVCVHYFDPDGRQFPGALNMGIMVPEYNKDDIILDAHTKSTWRTVLNEQTEVKGKKVKNAELLEPLLRTKDFYVNIPRTLAAAPGGTGAVVAADVGYFLGGPNPDDANPGVIRYTIAPVSRYSSSGTAADAEQLSITTQDPERTFMYDSYANLEYKKGRNNNLHTIDTVSLDSYLLPDPDAPNIPDPVDVWVRYRVVRSLPVFLLCRAVNETLPNGANAEETRRNANRKEVAARKFPVFDKDVYGIKSLTDNNADGNKLWKFIPCCKASDKYKALLKTALVPHRAGDDVNEIPFDYNDTRPSLLYVEDTEEGRSALGTYLKIGHKNYMAQAENDRLIAYPGHFDEEDGDDDRANNSLKIARKVELTKDNDNFIIDDFREVMKNKREKKDALGNLLEDPTYFSPDRSPIFAFWDGLDMLHAEKSLGACGNDPDTFQNFLDYSFSYIAGYMCSGDTDIFRSIRLERTVHGELNNKEETKMKDRKS